MIRAAASCRHDPFFGAGGCVAGVAAGVSGFGAAVAAAVFAGAACDLRAVVLQARQLLAWPAALSRAASLLAQAPELWLRTPCSAAQPVV